VARPSRRRCAPPQDEVEGVRGAGTRQVQSAANTALAD
jgi:hypothetical protein